MFRNDVRMEGKHMRKYNEKISVKANENLYKRDEVVRMQKRIVVIAALVIVSLGILLGTGISANASSKANVASYNKYYTSIRIEEGDTLWAIADEYIQGMDIDKKEYISEICEINGICEDEIHAGDYIVISYYSKEVK